MNSRRAISPRTNGQGAPQSLGLQIVPLHRLRQSANRLTGNNEALFREPYLYLSQKLEEIEDAASRQVFLDAVAHGSVISWQHINLLGEYDFSDKKLRDSVGIRSPKLTP